MLQRGVKGHGKLAITTVLTLEQNNPLGSFALWRGVTDTTVTGKRVVFVSGVIALSLRPAKVILCNQNGEKTA